MANNAKLAATNEELVAIVKKCPTKISISNERPTASRKRAAAGKHKGRGTQLSSPHFKKEGYHAPDTCFELLKKKYKRLPGWKSWL